MRYLLLLLAMPCFALEPQWEYPCAEDSTPISTVPLLTIPATGTYGVGVGDTVFVLSPRICTNTYPDSWYTDMDGDGNNLNGACFYVQGQQFSVADSFGANWGFVFKINSANNDYRDTVAIPSDALADSEWVTHPLDTFYLNCSLLHTGLYDEYTEDTRFILPCGATDCDSCAFIVFCDTAITQFTYDTLKILRVQDWPKFYQVEWFFRMATEDSFYFDTLMYVTEGDTGLYANRTPFTVTGTANTGTATITGWRSAGMDVYAEGVRVVSSVDSAEINQSHIPFSFTWSGLQPSVVESLQVWGLSDTGESSDTTTLKRRYLNLNSGQFIPR